MIRNLIIIKNDYASQSFVAQTLQHLRQECESDEVREDLINLSKNYN
jgi:hypothetical protein